MRNGRAKYAVLFLLAATVLTETLTANTPPAYQTYSRTLAIGDREEWREPDFDDSAWTQAGGILGDTVFWMRFGIEVFDAGRSGIHYPGLEIISVGTYEAYWDGVYIGTNGTYGKSKNEELPGTFISDLLLPDSLSGAGKHVLALRIAKFHGLPFPTFHTVAFTEFGSRSRNGLQVTAFLFILGGMFLFAGVYYLLLYLGKRKEATRLIYAAICLLFFGLLLLEYQKFYHRYTYDYQSLRLMLIALITLTLAFLLPLFFAVHFGRFQHWGWKVGFATLLTITQIYLFYNVDLAAVVLMQIAAVTSLLILAYEVWKGRREEAVYSLAALLIAFFLPRTVDKLGWADAIYLHVNDIALFLSFGTLVFAQLYLLVKRTREQRAAHEAGLLRSARLQNELLRKNIQPHFLLNTLTSLIDWVEESPEQSVLFIEALAEEFSVFNEIVEEKTVPLAKSIQLCKSHLKVMGYRKEITYRWAEEEGLEYDHPVPPGILLTLVENGVTHGKADTNGEIGFLLAFTRQGGRGFRYTLTVFADQHQRAHRQSGGTGLRYVRARLDENYGSAWTLTSGPISGGWQTTITVL